MTVEIVTVATVVVVTVVILTSFSKKQLDTLATDEMFSVQLFAILAMFLNIANAIVNTHYADWYLHIQIQICVTHCDRPWDLTT